MAEREQKKRPSSRSEEQTHDQTEPGGAPEDADATGELSQRGESVSAELDGILDEIDEVLETNAEEFVKSYVQKGGQ